MIELYAKRPGQDGDPPRSVLVATCPSLQLAGRTAKALYACYGQEIEIRQVNEDGSCCCWYTRNAEGSPTRAQISRAALVCREAQKRYFSTRGPDDLIASKRAEAALDKLIAEYVAGPPALPEGEVPDPQLELEMA